MKAFLLAAGLGTRLKPITDFTPKCLVSIYGKPLLAWWIKLFENHGIDEVLINLHYLPDQVVTFVEACKTRIKFRYFYEARLLGSAGTLRENKEFVQNDKAFLICNADNLTNYNLTNFIGFHKKRNSLFSISLFRTDTPNTKGIVLLDANNKVIDFEEKPVSPKSNLANAGIYISSQEVLDIIPELEVTDIGLHLLPKLIGRMNGWESKDYLIDIGMHTDLAKAEIEWKNLIEGRL